ncbi:MAG: 3-phosphoshikimate 1-carboxyvinyltransferase [Chlamydiae bacterium]|nr:3-phosphoshikimate 1-carboxyvinyltransferase [Chlamydiota bacterium]
MSTGLICTDSCLVAPSSLSGEVRVPPSKSQTQRALLFGLLAKGRSVIHYPLHSPDVEAMVQACRQLGAEVVVSSSKIEIVGVDGKISAPQELIDAGNSGQVWRFIGAIAALGSQPIFLTGDHSILHNRPIQPLIKALSQLGAQAQMQENELMIRGPISGGRVVMDGQDSQPVSGMLMAAAFAPGPVEITVNNPGEKPWVNLTLSWFDRLAISYHADEFRYYRLEGQSHYEGFSYTVPGDFSSAAFLLAAALITDSELTLSGLDLEDAQGDKRVLGVLEEMGAQLEVGDKISVKRGGTLRGITIDVSDIIDAVPILAVLGCYAEGETHIIGAEMARNKESDRLSAITNELRNMGADIDEHHDGLTIRQSQLHGTKVASHADHRIGMSLAVAALGAVGESEVEGISAIAKSYPAFFDHLRHLGASIL